MTPRKNKFLAMGTGWFARAQILQRLLPDFTMRFQSGDGVVAGLQLMLIVLCLTCSAGRAAEFVPTGVSEIDAMRRDFAANPTTPDNAPRRHSLIFSWVRHLVHRGVDMSDFHEPCANFSRWGAIDPSRYPAMKEAVDALEKIQANPTFIKEVRGTRMSQSPTATDWPVFGGNLEQSGCSPDSGPRTGNVAWRFPVGMSWYAAAAVEDGRVYVVSPGVTTLAHCLDERTGEVIWTTPQNGLQIYSTPRASSTPVIQKDHIVIRATSGSWEFEEKDKHIYCLDKRTGKVVRQLDADRVDYRRGCAPISGNSEYLVYPYGRLDLRGAPAFYEMQDTVVVRRANGAPWWTMRVGDLFAEPLLADNHVFAATDDGHLHALNLTGPQRIAWTFDAGSPLRSTPVADGRTVYVGALDGTLYALNIADGTVRWKLKLNQGKPRAQQLFSPPTLHDGKIYLGAATRELYCVDIQTGKLDWQAATSDWIRSRPLVVGNVIFAAGLDGKVAAFDLKGKEHWSVSVTSHPIFADLAGNERGILVSGSDLFLRSLDPASGKEQWKHSLLPCTYENGRRILADVVAAGGDYQSPPTVSNGKVFVGGPDRFVHAVDQQTGRDVWRFETSGQVSGAVTIQDGRVFFGQQGGNNDFFSVSEADGSPIWTAQTGWVWTTGTPHGERLFTGTVDGNIVALSTKDGRRLWKRPTNGGVYPAPAVSEGRVYTGSWDGYYYALDEVSGQTVWAYAKEGVDYRWGGGPDSAAGILWKSNFISRIAPQALVALDQHTGREKWRFTDTTRPKVGMNATASASGDKIFVSTSIDHDGMPCGGRLFCLDDTTGKLLWQYTGAGGWTGSSCTPDTVLCGSSTDVFITCLKTEATPEGAPQVIWRTRVDGIFQESIPAIHGDRAFILCSDGYLYAFE
ncbi:MAG: PQQ-binding-like beta-propeller repeat protein [Verrucomicrobia bacterium]|nr:PQQ-binding-like beta-propeller repeat protein [Verrucomicrobiota bacterium]